jgi:hypothetical protein
MRIEVQYLDGCPNLALAVDRVREALALVGLDATIQTTRMTDGVEFGGSPTVLVDGRDVEEDQAAARASCRTYPTPTGFLEGAPSVEAIRVAIRRDASD